MAQFGPAYDFLSAHEGGFQKNPNDKGNYWNGDLVGTNWGISGKYAREHGYTGRMEDLTEDQAMAWFRADFWNGLDEVENQAVASKLLDMRANMGVGTANRIAQQAANNLVEPPTAVDGAWGPDTILTINSADPQALIDQLADVSVAHYQAIVDQDPSQETWLRGWIKRALDVPAVIAGGAGLLLLLLVGGLVWMSNKGRGA